MPERADLGMRLYGMMQWLLGAYANQEAPQVREPRGVVELQDALDAVLQVAAVIDEETQAGRIPRERGIHAATMLMVIRDYIQPLPIGGTSAAEDHVTSDLEELVGYLREVRERTGHQG